MRPSCFTVSATKRSVSAVFATSPSMAMALRPCASIAFTVAATSWGSPLNQAQATSAPACANISAVAAPIPDAAPVTNATFPSSLNMGLP